MKTSNRSALATNPAITISFDVSIKDNRELVVTYTCRNTSDEDIYVFDQRPLWTQLWMNGQVNLMSVMPELTEWMEVLTPKVPPVKLLKPSESLSGNVSYSLPLKNTFPYPAGPIERIPVPSKLQSSQEVVLLIGYFKASEKVKLFDSPGSEAKMPGYYDLKHQFIARSKPVSIKFSMDSPTINIQSSSNPNCYK